MQSKTSSFSLSRIKRGLSLSFCLIAVVALWNHCSKDHNDPIIPLAITSVSPTEGPTGTLVTIAGTGFSTVAAANTVTFNGAAATITLATDKQLIATVPSSATTGPVKISVGGKEVTGSVFTVTQPSSLTVTGINPSSGLAGTEVTLTGTAFSTTAAQNIVKFNGVAAVVKSATATQLVVTVPASATTGTVSVQVGDKTVTASMFTVLTPAAPTLTNLAPASGKIGSTITLTGTGFSATASQNVVKFNDVEATVTNATATSLTVTVPAGATSGDVTVTVNGLHSTGLHFDVTIVITSYDPSSGSAGKPIVITGSGFDSNPSAQVVKFNGVVAVVTEATATTLKVIVPIGATTGEITVSLGANTSEGPVFTVMPVPQVMVSTVSLGPTATLSLPQGIAFDLSGNLLISDQGNNKIMKLTPSGLVLFAGSGTRSLTGPIDGPYLSAQFNLPAGLSVDKNTGDVYVADSYNNSIRKLAAGTPLLMVKTWAGNTNGQADISDGQGAGLYGTGAAGFYVPTGIVKSKNSATWFITDNWSHIIRKMDDMANVSTFAGVALNTGFINGKGNAALFHNPAGIAIDENDNLYIGDCVNDAIRKIDPAGNVTTYATGVGQVYGLAWDGNGNLYAASNTKHQILKIDSSGTVITIAGSTAGNDDGDGATAKFDSPWDLIIDADGNLYVSDQRNNLIRKITFQ
jgi:YD repeat-containing protein